MKFFKPYRWYDRELRFKSKQVDKWSLIIFLLAVASFVAATVEPTIPTFIRGIYLPCIIIWAALQVYSWVLMQKDRNLKRKALDR